DEIPWSWTNDTVSIIAGYRVYFNPAIAAAAVRKRIIIPPSARDLLRFYQVYMALINTLYINPSPRVLSVKMETIERSSISLAILVLLFVLTSWREIHSAWFLNRNNNQLEDLDIPGRKIQWMIHAVKCSE
ncbi:hypothetical protein P280DRAFT_363665, partial [Massarina eburnea CBS 473.64]